MQITRTSGELAPFRGGVCVPTMGALHDGHLALVKRAATIGRPVVVTIFVNPTQFGPGEDFDRYPRTFEADLEKCRQTGADAVFAPDVATVYPEGLEAPANEPPLPDVAVRPGLEDRIRPGHFAGVCRVVRRLFDLTAPRAAVFGEKDYQQLLVIRQLVRNEGRGIEIVGHPTVREPDGLAMSSRNVYLAPAQRQRALGLSRALREASTATTPAEAERAMRSVLLAHQVLPDYAVVRDAESLEPIRDFSRPVRALIAGRVGSVRLIDNAPIERTS